MSGEKYSRKLATKIWNEQVKLSVNTVNAGCLALLIGAILRVESSAPQAYVEFAMRLTAWALAFIIAHICARSLLWYLKNEE